MLIGTFNAKPSPLAAGCDKTGIEGQCEATRGGHDTAIPLDGRDDIMDEVEPGHVAHGGTYCGNVVAATAALLAYNYRETIVEWLHRRHRDRTGRDAPGMKEP